jgi:hypothetical protein
MALERACGACGSAFPLPVLVSTSTKSGTTKFRLRLRKHVLASAGKFKGVVMHPDHSALRGRSKDFLNKG